MDDGTFEEIGWDQAIKEVADQLVGIRDSYGGDKIMYYGGGGQGNHTGGAYVRSVMQTLGMQYRSNALAQEDGHVLGPRQVLRSPRHWGFAGLSSHRLRRVHRQEPLAQSWLSGS